MKELRRLRTTGCGGFWSYVAAECRLVYLGLGRFRSHKCDFPADFAAWMWSTRVQISIAGESQSNLAMMCQHHFSRARMILPSIGALERRRALKNPTGPKMGLGTHGEKGTSMGLSEYFDCATPEMRSAIGSGSLQVLKTEGKC